MKWKLILITSLLILFLAGCSKPDDFPPAPVTPAALQADSTQAKPAADIPTQAALIEMEPTDAVPTEMAPPETAPAASAGGGARSLDFNTLDICTFLPRAEVEKLLGTLSKDPQVDPPNGSEKGCLYYDGQGMFVDVILSPASDFDLLRQMHPDAVDIDFNGETAFSNENFSATELFVLHGSTAVIHVRVSSEDLEQARVFAALVTSLLK
jgi:hypothetical protein